VAASADLSVEQLEDETDPVQQLRIGSHIIRRLNERSWLVTDILRSAQGADPGLSETWRLWAERHLAAVRRAVASLESRGALSRDVTLDNAVDVFYALAGTDVYRALVRERGWSPDQYERWLFGLACRELLGQTAQARDEGAHRHPRPRRLIPATALPHTSATCDQHGPP
jgi:hypothetical protein